MPFPIPPTRPDGSRRTSSKMAEENTIDEANLGSRDGVGAWLEFQATMISMAVVSRLPRFMQNGLVSFLARIAMKLDKRHTQAARTFIGQALGPEAAKEDWRIHRAYVNLFQMSIDSHAFERKVPMDKVLDHYEIDAIPEVRAAWASGRGAVLVTSHIGDWEAGAAIMPHVGMAPAHVVARPPKNRYLSKHLLKVRERKRITVLPRRGGMKQIGAVIEQGGWIAMLLDQRSRGKHVLAPFFGRPTTCERSVPVLLKRLRMPIAFCACYNTDRPFYYKFTFPRLIEPEELDGMSIEEIVTLLNHEQEKLIMNHPEQYFWLHVRYRDAPPMPAEGAAESKATPKDNSSAVPS